MLWDNKIQDLDMLTYTAQNSHLKGALVSIKWLVTTSEKYILYWWLDADCKITNIQVMVTVWQIEACNDEFERVATGRSLKQVRADFIVVAWGKVLWLDSNTLTRSERVHWSARGRYLCTCATSCNKTSHEVVIHKLISIPNSTGTQPTVYECGQGTAFV